MVAYMDNALGKIVDRLKARGMWGDTLMVVSSDNGGPVYNLPQTGPGGASNLPLRGGKLSDFEGGVRVNAFVTGGAVPLEKRGTIMTDYIHLCDWYATFSAIAGVDATDQKAADAELPPVDGVDQSNLLLRDAASGSGNRTEIHHSVRALTRGKWKLITGGLMDCLFASEWHPCHPNGTRFVPFSAWLNGYGAEAIANDFALKDCGVGCLFDIRGDPNEHRDVAKEFPAVVRDMKERLAELNKGVFLPDRGSHDERACHRWDGFYGPFVGDVPDSRDARPAFYV